jgi:hypothetical protein
MEAGAGLPAAALVLDAVAIIAVGAIAALLAGDGAPVGVLVIVAAGEPDFAGIGALMVALFMAPVAPVAPVAAGVVVDAVSVVPAVLVPELAGCDSSPQAALSHSAPEYRPARPFPLSSFIGMLFLLWSQSRQRRLRAVSSRAQYVGCHVPIWPRPQFIVKLTRDCDLSRVAL